MKYAFVFPGQGSQYVGMGKELYDNFASAREVFEEVNEALSQNLFHIMTEGNIADLTMTANAQPAIMANSLAIVRVLEKEFGLRMVNKVSLLAGHSLGEYSACCVGKVFSLYDTAKLLRIRGEAMQKAVPQGEGGMAAIIGMSSKDIDALTDAASEGDKYCVAANDNSEEQIVISGHMQAIDKAMAIASEFGAKKTIKLSVSAPFHSPFMLSAQETMAEVFNHIQANNTLIPIVPNVLAEKITDASTIVNSLIVQITGMVRWRETMHYFEEQGITDLVEIGAGRVLTGLAKRDLKNINSFAINSIAEIESFMNNF